MIFEIIEECNDKDTVTAIIDNYTFNQIMKMLVCEAYHKGLSENANVDNDNSKEN